MNKKTKKAKQEESNHEKTRFQSALSHGNCDAMAACRRCQLALLSLPSNKARRRATSIATHLPISATALRQLLHTIISISYSRLVIVVDTRDSPHHATSLPRCCCCCCSCTAGPGWVRFFVFNFMVKKNGTYDSRRSKAKEEEEGTPGIIFSGRVSISQMCTWAVIPTCRWNFTALLWPLPPHRPLLLLCAHSHLI